MRDCQPPAPCIRFPSTMKQYRPNVDRQKWLYSMMKSQAAVIAQGVPEGRANDFSEIILDSSEFKIPGGVRSVADAFWISDRIGEAYEREYLAKLPTASAEQAAYMLARFLSPKVAEGGLHHSVESVRCLTRQDLVPPHRFLGPCFRSIVRQGTCPCSTDPSNLCVARNTSPSFPGAAWQIPVEGITSVRGRCRRRDGRAVVTGRRRGVGSRQIPVLRDPQRCGRL